MQRERGLLGTAYDWESNARPASFDDVRMRHRTLPADQLVRVASRYLQQAGPPGSSINSGGGGSLSLTIGARKEAAAAAGPAAVKSLLSRVDSCDHNREENEVGGRQADASFGKNAENTHCSKKKTLPPWLLAIPFFFLFFFQVYFCSLVFLCWYVHAGYSCCCCCYEYRGSAWLCCCARTYQVTLFFENVKEQEGRPIPCWCDIMPL